MLIDKILENEKSLCHSFAKFRLARFYSAFKAANNFYISKATNEQIHSLTEKSSYYEIAPYVKLPYPVCFFEIDTEGAVYKGRLLNKVGVLANEAQDILEVIFLAGGKEGVYMDGIFIRANKVTDELTIGILNDNINKRPPTEEEKVAAREHAGSFFKTLYLLNCPNLLETEKADLSILNKSREKKGRPPLKEYSTIKLKLTKEERASIKEGNKHNSPRCHLRRGHFRNLPDKVVWVRHCVVGNGQRIKQNYKVVA